MDGFTGYKTATGEALPGAIAVMDPFHVVRLAGDALDRVPGQRDHRLDGAAWLRRPVRSAVGTQTRAPPPVPGPRDHRSACPAAGPASLGPVALGRDRPDWPRPPRRPARPRWIASGPSLTALLEDLWNWTPGHRDRHAADRHTLMTESTHVHRQRRQTPPHRNTVKDRGRLSHLVRCKNENQLTLPLVCITERRYMRSPSNNVTKQNGRHAVSANVASHHSAEPDRILVGIRTELNIGTYERTLSQWPSRRIGAKRTSASPSVKGSEVD